MGMTVDEMDARIVTALQLDGRRSNASLAKTVGLSESATLQRVRRLERDGTILGYMARLAPEAVGIGVHAFIGVRLRWHSHDAIAQFEQQVGEVTSILSCTHVTGQFDYILQIGTRDLAHLREVIRDDLSAIPGVSKLETMLGLADVKAFSGWPIHTDK